MRALANAPAFGLRPSAGTARLLLVLSLLAASCSWEAEVAEIFVHVDGIAPPADHLEVVVTPSDTAAVGTNNCGGTALATNVTCYRPSFQPVDATAGMRSIDLAFAAPSRTGTFTLNITAFDGHEVAQGVGATAGTLPGPVNLQVTLH
jgi:hypothetical protein